MTRLFSFATLLVLLFLQSALPLAAQRRKNSPARHRATPVRNNPVPVRSAADAIAAYDWHTAEQRIAAEIAATSSPTVKDSLNAALQRVQRAAELMNATKKVVWLDSLSLDRAHWLDSLSLSPEAGRFVPGTSLGTSLTNCGTAFVNALETEAILPAGQPRQLYRLVKAGNRWSVPEPLPGLDSSFTDINYPFLTSGNGTTLVFSAHHAGSGIGGRDLFITRYNPDTRRFVRPVHLGMPFNSPADDFCYALDDTRRQGYLFTNRRQPSDRMCRYTFLFDTPNFEELNTDDESLRRQLAALLSVSASQAGQTERIARHRKMLASQQHQLSKTTPSAFTFVIDDDRLATSLTDFQSETGRQLAEKWLELTKESRTVAQQRDEAERRYANNRNEADAQTLRRTELTLSLLHQEIKTIAKEIRRAEQR